MVQISKTIFVNQYDIFILLMWMKMFSISCNYKIKYIFFLFHQFYRKEWIDPILYSTIA
jgi:hypothetical protein